MLPSLVQIPTDAGKRGGYAGEEEQKREARRERRRARYSRARCSACERDQPNQEAHYGGCVEDPDFPELPSDVSSDEECGACEEEPAAASDDSTAVSETDGDAFGATEVTDALAALTAWFRPSPYGASHTWQYDESLSPEENARAMVRALAGMQRSIV